MGPRRGDEQGVAMTATIHEVLAELRTTSSSEREKGDRFERLMRAYLATDTVWSERFDAVWLWGDWPDRTGADVGIDLVARERSGGGLCAIQCKFYDAGHTLAKADIDSFFTASGKAPFASRLIISTTDKWSSNAEAALANQQIPVTRLRVADLDESTIDWRFFTPAEPEHLTRREPKRIRPHQQDALDDVLVGFAAGDRGKLIMACGTGKTFTSLQIAEAMVPSGGSVLVLVPSISLVSQTLREWAAAASVPLRPFAVCSDTKVGRRRKADDSEDISLVDLPFPASTDPAKLAARVLGGARTEGVAADGDAGQVRAPGEAAYTAPAPITVVYSTYQSIDVIAEAQRLGLPRFDLIICDEAHRTTGVTLVGADESHFVKVHDDTFIGGAKRLYMTATPRLYDDTTKSSAKENAAVICSMDDEALYGPEFHRLGFGKAVERGLLTDYKVLILTVDEEHIAGALQAQIADENNEINLDDAVKIVGCWNGLAKRTGASVGESTASFRPGEPPMARAVAFSRSIAESKALTAKFDEVIGAYNEAHSGTLACEVHHVDGTFNALARSAELDWLSAPLPPETCRILSNARCLSEGVDVPTLDAVLFLNPRNSVVDVVQSVGRVMRRAPGKEYGYIILPVGIPSGMAPEVALRDNKRYRVIWQVLQALRAHDDRFNATVNKIELNTRKPDNIMIGHVGPGDDGDGSTTPEAQAAAAVARQQALFNVDDWRDAIYAKIVTKVGERAYWENWAADVAGIAERHVARITALVADPDSEKGRAFTEFLAELRSNINPGLRREDAIDMLAQHLITAPVFDALFGSDEFTRHNPVSVTMDAMLATLDDHALAAETETLEGFYASVRMRAAGIDNHEGRQRIITELYERFFKVALPKTAEAFGIVYTPIEVVDFILRSVDWALREHFEADLSSEGVQVLDPFTGTGTFIVRLLQSGLIREGDLRRKYREELHANEILLLAYYIAAINIEATYHQVRGVEGGPCGHSDAGGVAAAKSDSVGAEDSVGEGGTAETDAAYEPFDGIVLTDTFQLTEDPAQTIPEFLQENNKRLERQKALDIRVMIGNPPYSVGQTSQNDDNKNAEYQRLDERIRETYAAESGSVSKRNLYDSYVRAIRWASDRIGDEGVVCFVSNGGWIDANTGDGLRKCLAAEFTDIYVFNLRGNQRTAGELSRKEGGKVFGSGSRSTVAITLLIKSRSDSDEPAKVHYRDIGDYLTREQKLRIVAESAVSTMDWELVKPDEGGDWLNQASSDFAAFAPIGVKSEERQSPLFSQYSLGVATARDSWVYGFSHDATLDHARGTIETYEAERSRLAAQLAAPDHRVRGDGIDELIDHDATRISWTRGLKNDLRRNKPAQLNTEAIFPAMYRPFCRQWLYFDRQLNDMVYRIPRFFPTPHHENVGFYVVGVGSDKPFSTLMTSHIPDLAFWGSSNGQFFPRYTYEKVEDDGVLFGGLDLATGETSDIDEYGYRRIDNITDAALASYRGRYGLQVTKDDVFDYVYGLLHSPEYRSRFAADLKKMLPRIPQVDAFEEYVAAGRALAELHLGYESIDPWPLTVTVDGVDYLTGGRDLLASDDAANPPSVPALATGTRDGDGGSDDAGHGGGSSTTRAAALPLLRDATFDPEVFRVQKMAFAKRGREVDRSTIIYNSRVRVSGIPTQAYDYMLGSRNGVEWLIDRYQVKTDKASGIVNDPNDWCSEHGEPRYIVELVARVVRVSVESVRVVAALPGLGV